MEEKKKGRIYPNSFETEESMLSCFLQNGMVCGELIPIMDESYFYNSKHKKIFKAILTLFENNTAVDIISVNDFLDRTNENETEMLDYLATLSNVVRSTANYKDYFKALKRDKVLRDLIDICNTIIEDAYSATDEAPVIAKAEKLIYGISKAADKRELKHIKEPMDALMQQIDVMSKNKGALRGLATGFPLFDKVTNGLQKGNLIILAARPAVGKTAFALNIVANIAINSKEKKRIAFFSLEMADVELAQRLLCSKAGVSMNQVNKGTVNFEDMSDLWKVHKDFYQTEVYVDDTTAITPQQILSKVRRLTAGKNGGIDLIVVDYLQLMTGDRRGESRGKDMSRQQDISDISRAMKVIAKEIRCPVIALCQMSRSIEQRLDKTPVLSDLRESGAIEQDADIVMFLSREREEQDGSSEQSIVLTIAKHRNGERKSIRFDWEGEFVRFTESDNQESISLPRLESKPKG